MLDIKIWQIAQELVKCGGHQYSGVHVQDKYRNLLKKYKDISDAKNNKKETKPWKFYDAFHEAVKDKLEISLKHIRESGACKRDLHDKVFSFFYYAIILRLVEFMI